MRTKHHCCIGCHSTRFKSNHLAGMIDGRPIKLWGRSKKFHRVIMNAGARCVNIALMIFIFKFPADRRLFILKCSNRALVLIVPHRSMASIIFRGFRLNKFSSCLRLLHRMISVKPTERSASRNRCVIF